MVKEAYGISFTDDTASIREMDLKFVNEGPGALASVAFTTVGGVANKLTLNVNMDYYDKLNQTDPNGSTETSGAGYLDRTLAHELTHAVMAANIKDMGSLPLAVVEGAAEYTHGIDDQRVVALKALKQGDVKTSAKNSEVPYAAGYAFLHYLNAQSGHDGGAMKRLMSTLVAKGGAKSGLDSAIAAASKGGFSTWDEATAAFDKDMGAASDIETFLKDKCDIDMKNLRDTGSATGSKSWNGEEADGEEVVIDGLSTRFWWYPSADSSTIEGLTMHWGDYPRLSMEGRGFRFQTGTKANQNILAAFSDIHANALASAAMRETTSA